MIRIIAKRMQGILAVAELGQDGLLSRRFGGDFLPEGTGGITAAVRRGRIAGGLNKAEIVSFIGSDEDVRLFTLAGEIAKHLFGIHGGDVAVALHCIAKAQVMGCPPETVADMAKAVLDRTDAGNKDTDAESDRVADTEVLEREVC